MGEASVTDSATPAQPSKGWTVVVVGLALIPALLVFYGAWSTNLLYEYGDVPRGVFYIVTSICLAGIYVLILRGKPAATNLLIPFFPANPLTSLPRWRNMLSAVLILFSALAVLRVVWVSLASKQLPGVELLLGLMVHWLGWNLRLPIEKEAVVGLWKRLQRWLPQYLLFLIAGILSLSWIYNRAIFQIWFLLPAAGAGILLWLRRKEVPVIAWLMLLALALYSYRLDHWLYSVVGDEYIFYHYAELITDKPFIINANLFNCCYVYGQHPFISSLLQAIWMAIFGATNFGWRFLNPLLCALSLPLFYVFFKTFAGRKLALTTIALLACSAYLMNFLKIGYNNPSAFFGHALVLAATAWVIRKENPAAYVGLALAGGLCAYLYPASLYILAVAILLLIMMRPPVTIARLLLWALAGLVFGALISPLILQPQMIPMRIIGTYYWSPTLRQSTSALLQHSTNNFVMALFSNFHTPAEDHFVASGYLDPFSAGLGLIGLALAAFWARRERFSGFMFISFFLMLFLVGVSHDRSTPSTTRMFTLLPWFAFFAALGLEWILSQFRAGVSIRWIILGVILFTNFNQAYSLALTRKTSFQSLITLTVKLAQDLERVHPGQERTYLFLSAANWNPFGLEDIKLVYPQFLGRTRIEDLNISEGVLPQLASRASAPETFVIIPSDMNSPWIGAAEQTLSAVGKDQCIQRTGAGDARFTLWYTADVRFPNGPCYPAAWVLPDWIFWAAAGAAALVLDIGWMLWQRRRKRKPRDISGAVL